MLRSLSHVVMFTEDLDATLRLLTEVANVSPVRRFDNGDPADVAALFDWPVEHSATRGALVGEGPGTIDLVEIPPGLRGKVAPGVRLLGLPTRDSAAAGRAANAAGFATRGPFNTKTAAGTAVTIVEAIAGGLSFELIQFD